VSDVLALPRSFTGNYENIQPYDGSYEIYSDALDLAVATGLVSADASARSEQYDII